MALITHLFSVGKGEEREEPVLKWQLGYTPETKENCPEGRREVEEKKGKKERCEDMQ